MSTTSLHLPRFLRPYLWGNLHLALGAFLCVWATRVGASGRVVAPGLLACAMGLGAAAVYGLDRLAGAKPSGPRGDWFLHHRRLMWVWSVAAGVSGMVLVFTLPWAQVAVLGVGALVAVGYGIKVVKWRGQWQPLGAFLWARPGLVALAWMLGTATVPLMAQGVALDSTEALRWQAGRLLLTASLVIPFDVRDRELDLTRGVSTLATRFGAARAFWISRVLAFAALGVALLPHPQPEALAGAAGGCVLLCLTDDRRGAVWRLLVLDGVLHLHALGVLWRWVAHAG